MFLGYSLSHHAYKCFNPSTKNVVIARHVIFDENSFPFSSFRATKSSVSSICNPIRLSPLPCDFLNKNFNTTSSFSVPESNKSLHVSSISSQHFVSDSPISSTMSLTSTEQPFVVGPSCPSSSLPPVVSSSPNPSVRTHPMKTRAMSGIFKKKVFCATAHPISQALVAEYQHQEPTCYSLASKHKCWTDAMAIEFNALMSTNTWSLVPRIPDMNVIGFIKLKRRLMDP